MRANKSVSQTDDLNNSTFTGIKGIMLGMYEAYVGGQFVTNLYSDSYIAALVEFDQLLEDYRSVPLFVSGVYSQSLDWYTCQECGASVDAGKGCLNCIPFDGGPTYPSTFISEVETYGLEARV